MAEELTVVSVTDASLYMHTRAQESPLYPIRDHSAHSPQTLAAVVSETMVVPYDKARIYSVPQENMNSRADKSGNFRSEIKHHAVIHPGLASRETFSSYVVSSSDDNRLHTLRGCTGKVTTHEAKPHARQLLHALVLSGSGVLDALPSKKPIVATHGLGTNSGVLQSNCTTLIINYQLSIE